MDPRLADLSTFGLTEPQIAAYSYLLKRDATTAPEVATGAGIPRNRAYEILDGLAALGLVQVVAGAKRHYKALPIGPFLARKIGEAQSGLDRLKERAPGLERELAPKVDSQGFLGAFATWRGAHVQAAAERLLKDAQEAIHVSAPPVAVHRWLTPLFGDLLERRRADGLDVRLLVTLCEHATFDPLLDVSYKLVPAGGGIAKLVIDRRVLFVRATDGRKDDEAYELRHEGLAAEAVSIFDHFWACPGADPEAAAALLRVPRAYEEGVRIRPADTNGPGAFPRPDTR